MSNDFSTTDKVTDIRINRAFLVHCNDHGTITAKATYAEAVAARRDHFFEEHKADKS